MAAKISPAVLSSHMQNIVDIGFGRWAKREPLLSRTACFALQRLSEEDKKKLLSANGSCLFGILEVLATSFSLPENIWYATADKAIATIYSIYPSPETKSVFDYCGGELEADIVHGSSNILTAVQVTTLIKYRFIVSHSAMHQLVYIESCARKIQKEKAKKRE